MNKEKAYIAWRLCKSTIQSIPFYLFRVFPINKRKIVFMTIEGTTGFMCNPKYIALEMIKRNENKSDDEKYELVWLVDDTSKEFPKGINKVKNSLLNRAFHLTTAHIWVDDSRKQLECRKRRGQIYIQTWHAKIGFKPTCLDRGASFSKIAYLVSKHDSDMVDYWLSNSDWYDKTLKNGSLYEGKTLRCGSPRCDVLVESYENRDFKMLVKQQICERYGLTIDSNRLDSIHFLMYAPTFRGGSQGVNRQLREADHFPDFEKITESFIKRFGGEWIVLLRLHPQMTARNLTSGIDNSAKESKAPKCIDVSRVDDMYEILAGCDAFITDYSSAAFDAMVMNIPIFLYCDDYERYEKERGSLLWDLRKLSFPFSDDIDQLQRNIEEFDEVPYQNEIQKFLSETGMKEGNGSIFVADFIAQIR